MKLTNQFFFINLAFILGHLSYKKDLLKKLLKIKNIIGVKEGSWDYKSYVNNYKFLKKIKKNFLVMASGDEHLYPCFQIC